MSQRSKNRSTGNASPRTVRFQIDLSAATKAKRDSTSQENDNSTDEQSSTANIDDKGSSSSSSFSSFIAPRTEPRTRTSGSTDDHARSGETTDGEKSLARKLTGMFPRIASGSFENLCLQPTHSTSSSMTSSSMFSSPQQIASLFGFTPRIYLQNIGLNQGKMTLPTKKASISSLCLGKSDVEGDEQKIPDEAATPMWTTEDAPEQGDTRSLPSSTSLTSLSYASSTNGFLFSHGHPPSQRMSQNEGDNINEVMMCDPAMRREFHRSLPLQMQGYNWRVLYSTRRDGTSLRTMLKMCGNKEPLLIMIMDHHRDIFGAYIDSSFEKRQCVFEPQQNPTFRGGKRGTTSRSRTPMSGTESFRLSSQPGGESYVWSFAPERNESNNDDDDDNNDNDASMASPEATSPSLPSPQLRRYDWSLKNNYFLDLSTEGQLMIGGGGGGPAIFLNKYFTDGTSYSCETFNSTPLFVADDLSNSFRVLCFEILTIEAHA